MKMDADRESRTAQYQGQSQQTTDTDAGALNCPVVEMRRSSWAKQSRELKKSPWKFPGGGSSSSSEADPMDSKNKSVSQDSLNSDPEITSHPSDPDGASCASDCSGSVSDGSDDTGPEVRRCNCCLRSSLTMDSVDEVDGICCEQGDTECIKAAQFMQSVSCDTRTMVAKYLSTGNPQHLKINKDNLHDILHLAKMLTLLQLYNQCMKFCMSEKQEELVPIFGGCECVQDVMQESRTGYHRFVSITGSQDDDSSPAFYCAVSSSCEDGSQCRPPSRSSSRGKRSVIVIDTVRKAEVFQRSLQGTPQLGPGSDCCCVYKKDSPYVFACGGEGKNAHMCWKYDVVLGRWNKGTKMLHHREGHTLVPTSQGLVFVLGGTKTDAIDEFNISANKWTRRAYLITPVHSPVCVLHKDKIYIFGGKTAAGPVSKAQCYSTVTHNVSPLPDLPCEFVNGQAVAFGDKLYIATEQGHMICYVPETGESFLCSQQPVQRTKFGMFLRNDRIYLVGGVARGEGEDEEPINTPMYRYNPYKDTYTAEKNLGRSFPVFSSCIVSYPKYCPVVPFDDKC